MCPMSIIIQLSFPWTLLTYWIESAINPFRAEFSKENIKKDLQII